MKVETVNPYTEEKIGSYEIENIEQVKSKIEKIRVNQAEWGMQIDERIDYFMKVLKPNLVKFKPDLARLITSEMGKPISQSLSEIDKCIDLVEFASRNYTKFLENDYVETGSRSTYVRFDPIGVIGLIMPWNYPLWQVMRAAIPAMLSGNGVILKHASIVTGTSLMIEEIFDSPVFSSVVIPGKQAIDIIKYLDGVSFTGSTNVGSSIAQEAGKHLKKVVLELGGSDPFIVLPDADIDKTVKNAVFARLQNGGQSCIASKRFLIHEKIFDEFRKKFYESFHQVNVGDPSNEKTFLGPLSSREQADTVSGQIAQLRPIGEISQFSPRKGNTIFPTIAVTDGKFTEEIFGPVAILKKFRTEDEAISLANETPFGLGSSIWGNPDSAEKMAPRIQSGMVYINKIVASDPRVPFGGTKRSGLGRELSRYGLLEFTNIKTVWIESSPK